MTRQEKENGLLYLLNVNVGDILKLEGVHDFEACHLIVEYSEMYGRYILRCRADNKRSIYYNGWLGVEVLLRYDFHKVKCLGNKECNDVICNECPLRSICQRFATMPTGTRTLFQMLEFEKSNITQEKYMRLRFELEEEQGKEV